MSTPWEVLTAVARRNGLDALVLCGHITTAHDADPNGPQWAGQCEAAAICLLDVDRAHRDLAEVTS